MSQSEDEINLNSFLLEGIMPPYEGQELRKRYALVGYYEKNGEWKRKVFETSYNKSILEDMKADFLYSYTEYKLKVGEI